MVAVAGHQVAHGRAGGPSGNRGGVCLAMPSDIDRVDVLVGIWSIFEAAVLVDLRHQGCGVRSKVFVSDCQDVEFVLESLEVLIALDPGRLALLWRIIFNEVRPELELACNDISWIADDSKEADITAGGPVLAQEVEPAPREDQARCFVKEDRAKMICDSVPELEDLIGGAGFAWTEKRTGPGEALLESAGFALQGVLGIVPEVGLPVLECLIDMGDADCLVVSKGPIDRGGAGAFETEQDDGPLWQHGVCIG